MGSQSPLYGSLHSKSLHQRVEEDRRFMVGMTAIKSSQCMSMGFPPFYCLLRTLNSMPTPLPGLLKWTGIVTMGTAPLNGLAAWWFLSHEPTWMIRDSAQRFRSATGHRWMDAVSALGAVTFGAVAAAVPAARAGPVLPRTAGGAALGIAMGPVVYFASGGRFTDLLGWNT